MIRILLIICAAVATWALDTRDVFRTGTEGYGVYRIPGLIVTSKGTLLAYAEARKTAAGLDWDAIDIVVRRSEDGGKTWSENVVIHRGLAGIQQNPVAAVRKRPADTITFNNPVAIADRKPGVVHFLFCAEYMRAFYSSSEDDGKSFSPPVEITATFDAFRPEYDWRVIATGPGHGIQTRRGRLVVPVWLSSAEKDPHHPNLLATIYSDDRGKTWKRGSIALRGGGEVENPNETAAVELADGQVMLNVRSMSAKHRRIVITSQDGASNWSAPRFQEELLEPICFGSIARHGNPKRKRLVFVNPDTLERIGQAAQPGRPRDRKNLTVQLSEDDGRTWKWKRVIDAGGSGYADIATDRSGAVLVLYERGELIAGRLRIEALTLVRMPLEWIKETSR